MPIYSYRCKNCDYSFDQQQSFDDEHLHRCPNCGESALRKVYLPVGIVFRGSGFYSTDNRTKSSNSVPKKSDKAAKKENDGEKDTSGKQSATAKKSSPEKAKEDN